MDDNLAKSEVVTKVVSLLKTISDLAVKPQIKLKIVDRFIPSQISFNLRIYNFPLTWVEGQIDALCIRYIRQWIEAPVSSCVGEWLITPTNRCGMGIPSFKNRMERLRLSKRSTLKSSRNESIRELWNETNLENVDPDSLLLSAPFNKAKTVLINSQQKEAENHLLGLPYQGKAIKVLLDCVSPKLINDWSKLVEKLPGFLFNFVYKALQSQLPTFANLVRWGKSVSNQCPICGQPQTNKHVLSNCSNPDALSRYSNRHDKVLSCIANWFSSKINNEFEMFVDLPNFKQCSDLFVAFRPDIVFVGKQKAYVLELTVCHETNMISSKNYKLNKYKDLQNAKSEILRNHDITVMTCELSVLGFLHMNSDILKVLGILNSDVNFREELSKCAITESFNIYIRRNN
jgi:hypothetical protein